MLDSWYESLDNMIKDDKFPQFVILCGAKGSGKTYTINAISKMLNRHDGTVNIFAANGIDAVREAIANAYKCKSPTLYCFDDSDGMSVQAKNAMLKVTEEPPNNSRFIMAVSNLEGVLPTIRSRGTVLTIPVYTPQEIEEYARECGFDDEDIQLITSICRTPGDVREMHETGLSSIINYVDKVMDKIHKVSGSNCFKIASNLKLTETSDGFDLELFLDTFIQLCTERLMEDIKHYGDAIIVTSHARQALRTKGINKQMLIDNWILDMRKVWKDKD